MEKAPLQIYFSALVFAPSTSPIRNHFGHVPMQWIKEPPTIRTHWGSLQQTLECNPHGVLHITFSPCGNVLASTSGHTISLWDPSSGRCLNTLEGHDGMEELDDEVDHDDFQNGFGTIAFSPDSKILASASLSSSRVWLWDVLTGQCLHVLRGHTRAVNQVSFSCNGNMLASSSYDQTVRLWDPCTGNCLQILTGHTDCVRAVAFSPALHFANILASVSDDDSIRIWDSTTAKCIRYFETNSNEEELRILVFSSDGNILASAHGDKSNATSLLPSKIQLWNPMTGECLHILHGHSNKVTAIAFSPIGNILASASWDGSVRLWDLLDGQCRAILKHNADVFDVAFAPDGKTLASSTSNDDVRLWDLLTRQCFQKMEGHSSWVHSVAFSPSSNNSEDLLASAALDDTVILWSTSAEKGQAIAQDESDTFSNLALSCDGKKLVLWADKTIHLRDLSTEEHLRRLGGHPSQIYSVAILPDGERMVSNDESTIHLWDLSTGQQLQTLDYCARYIDGTSISPDGERIALIDPDDQIQTWNPSSGEGLQSLDAPGQPGSRIRAATFSPDGDKFASLSYDSMLRVWDMSTGHFLQTLQASTVYYHTCAITSGPGGFYVALSSYKIAELWDASTGQCLQTLRGHMTNISMLAFSSNGRLLASASGDPDDDWAFSRSNLDYNSLRIWNPFTGQCLHIIDGTPGIRSLSFSSDGQYLNTSLGALSLSPFSESVEENDDTKPLLFVTNTWIILNGQNHLWLPPEYRPKYTAVYGNIIVILTGDHRMIIFNFSLHESRELDV